jgi:hypothetical protein
VLALRCHTWANAIWSAASVLASFNGSMAALVMNHPNMERDLGRKDLVCQKVVHAAREANITDARFPSGTSPECVLLDYSKIMQSKSVELNFDRPLPDEDVTTHLKFMTERMDENTHKTASTAEQVQELRGSFTLCVVITCACLLHSRMQPLH